MSQPTSPVPGIDVMDAARRLADRSTTHPAGNGLGQPLLVDVREINEFEQVRVAGSVLIPLSEFSTRYEELPRDRELLIMCAGGKRSFIAADLLIHNGFSGVYNIEGGIIDWQARGLPIRQGRLEEDEGALPDR